MPAEHREGIGDVLGGGAGLAGDGEVRRKLGAMTPDNRRDPGQRLGVSKPIYNSLEWLTAAELQRAHPDRGYLTQVELVSVETAAKRVSVQDLTSAVNPKKRRFVESACNRAGGGSRANAHVVTGNSRAGAGRASRFAPATAFSVAAS